MGLISLGLENWLRRPETEGGDRPGQKAKSITFDQFSSLGLVGPPVAAGVPVTQHTANTVSAYWNGVCVISGDIGTLDRHLYRRIGDDDRERATSHPAYKLVHDQPNPQTTAVKFWETIAAHAVSWGNGYAEIEWDGALRPIGLWLITPDLMEAKVEIVIDRRGRASSRVYYLYRGTTRLEAEDVLHIPGPGFDGVRGYSPVYLARQSLGLSIAAERFGGAFFGNGATPGVALQHPKTLTDKAVERLKASLQNEHGGPDRAHKMIVLEEGMTVSKPISIPPDDAQFLETRQFQIEEVARWLNISPHKLKHEMGARPGGNLESSELDYSITTLMPWTTRIEQECDRKLIAPSQRGTYYTEHNYQKRLKTDTTTRMNSYKTLFELEVMDAEQIARKENLPKPKPRPAAAAPADPGAPAAEPPVADPIALPSSTTRQKETLPAPDEKVVRAALGVARDAVGRFSRREAAAVKRASKKGATDFQAWAEAFYRDELPVLRGSLLPAVRLSLACRGVHGDAEVVSRRLAEAYLERSKEELLGLPAKDLEDRAAELVDRWETGRGHDLADEILSVTVPESAEPAA